MPLVTLLCCNAQSLRSVTKQRALRGLLLSGSVDILAVQETFLCAAFPDSFLVHDTDFAVYRRDREAGGSSKRGGGVALFLRRCFAPSQVTVSEDVEIVCVDIVFATTKVRVASCYRPPNATADYVEAFCDTLTDLSETPNPIIFVGDFNYPSLSGFGQNSSPSNASCKLFSETILQLSLSQLNEHLSRAANDNILDLIFVSSELVARCEPVECVEPLGASDHFMLSLKLSLQTQSEPSLRKYRNFRKTDFEGANNFLSAVDWDFYASVSPDVETLNRHIVECLNLAIESFVPWSKPRSNASLPPHLLRLRRKMRRQWRARGSDPAAFHSSRLRYNSALKAYFRREEDSLLQADSLSSFYRLVKSKTKGTDLDTIVVEDEAGQKVSEPAKVAEVFSRFFSSVYTSDDGRVPRTDRWEGPRLVKESVSEWEIITALRDTAPKTGCGPCGIPALFLKGVAKSIAKPLSVLYSWSLVSAQTPSLWRKAFVSPHYKGKRASKLSPNSFRPLSKTSSIAKLLEKIVVKAIHSHYNRCGVISSRQFGFRAHHSTVTQLLRCVDDWTRALAAKRVTYIIYIDFRKAFDSVSHNKLIIALRSRGFSDQMLSWLASYLSNRTQQVRIMDTFSKPAPTSSGVLQGSVAGPCAFIGFIQLCIDELAQINNVEVQCFADDLKLYSSCPIQLQKALTCLERWCETWQLTVAPAKCHVLQIGTGPSPPFTLAGLQLPYVESAVDLGITITPDLLFGEHCQSLAKAAKRSAFLTLRCFHSGRVAPLLRAYLTYVRPKLEYATQVFYPAHKRDLQALEKVQQFYTRRLFVKAGLKPCDYDKRLRYLKLDRLDIRRVKLDLLLCYKMFRGMTPDCYVIVEGMNIPSARNKCHLLKERYTCLARSNFFANRVVDAWNSIPESVIRGSEDQFKKYIAL